MITLEIHPFLNHGWEKIGEALSPQKKLLVFFGIILGGSLLIFDLIMSLILGLLLADVLISRWMSRSGPPGIGLETASLATILAGMELSPLIGGFVGVFSVLMRLGVGLSGAFILWKLPGFAALGILTGTLVESLVPEAVLLLAALRLFFAASSYFLQPEQIASEIVFSITNIILIYFLALKIKNLGII
jgi:hypothetical protein